jgi:hypothetical protein
MEAGEEFIVTEGDEGGWTKVRRKNSNSVGVEGLMVCIIISNYFKFTNRRSVEDQKVQIRYIY